MITIPTTFVIGAGASNDFGFLLGGQLITKIHEIAHQTPPHMCEMITGKAGAEGQNLMHAFVEAMRRSCQPSIDAFLERHPGEFQELGKRAIAAALIPCEMENNLFPIGTQTWCKYLFAEMGNAFDAFAQNNVRFITFNYDRSLEHFFTTALANTYNKSPSDAWKMVQHLAILHIHGSLCPYDPVGDPIGEDKSVRAYHPLVSPEILERASKCIRIVHENDANDPICCEARRHLQESKRVVFLGFHYLAANMTKLNPSVWRNSCKVFGTCFGMGTAERATAQQYFENQMTLSNFNHKILDFFKEIFSIAEVAS